MYSLDFVSMDVVILVILICMLWIVPIIFAVLLGLNRRLSKKQIAIAVLLNVFTGWASVAYLETIPIVSV